MNLGNEPPIILKGRELKAWAVINSDSEIYKHDFLYAIYYDRSDAIRQCGNGHVVEVEINILSHNNRAMNADAPSAGARHDAITTKEAV